mmetsp:Transcript_54391/g.102002  ORF Transcript_54391/g.102002 Transcript_54391/m.102002 type:complete len:218 (-) Transcript_54391:58-711(-)
MLAVLALSALNFLLLAELRLAASSFRVAEEPFSLELRVARAVVVVAGLRSETDVRHVDLTGSPVARLQVLELQLVCRLSDSARCLERLSLRALWDGHGQEPSVRPCEAKGAIHVAVGVEGGLEDPVHANLPLLVLLHGFPKLLSVPNGVQGVQTMVLRDVVALLQRRRESVLQAAGARVLVISPRVPDGDLCCVSHKRSEKHQAGKLHHDGNVCTLP